MKDLKKLYEICLKEVTDAGIEPGVIKSVYAKSSGHAIAVTNEYNYGTKNSYFTIQVEPSLLKDEISEIIVKERIVHEICHTVYGCFNHGKNWKRVVKIMNDKYGYEITTKSDIQELGIQDKIEFKYKYVCKGCGQVVGFNSMCKFVKNYQNYRCGKCHGDFEKIAV